VSREPSGHVGSRSWLPQLLLWDVGGAWSRLLGVTGPDCARWAIHHARDDRCMRFPGVSDLVGHRTSCGSPGFCYCFDGCSSWADTRPWSDGVGGRRRSGQVSQMKGGYPPRLAGYVVQCPRPRREGCSPRWLRSWRYLLSLSPVVVSSASACAPMWRRNDETWQWPM
jgi:hypothetical protein